MSESSRKRRAAPATLRPMDSMVTGLGGVFFRARDPDALRRWYEEVLGVPAEDLMRSDGLVFGVFDSDTDYFGASGQAFMLNFRVASLDADPEGNRFELWEPAEGM